MTAGLPGVGIGGIFYLVSALLMPVRALMAVAGGRANEARWPLALRQASLAAGVLAALWITGWALGWLIGALAPDAPIAAPNGMGGTPREVHNVVKTSALLLSFGTLSAVLVVVQVLRVLLPVRPTVRNVARERRSSQSAA